jgi:glycosyltransferase involved in cell wall biosynthesis
VKTSHSPIKRIKLGIVANEFFGREIGGIGGFGWAARQVASFFNHHPEYGVEAIFLNQTLPLGDSAAKNAVHNTRMITRGTTRLSNLRRLQAERFDLLLMVDYRPSYRFSAAALPLTPIIVWVRDPRTSDDMRKINTLRIPGAEGVRPQGIDPIDCTSLAKIAQASRLLRRPLRFATPAPHLADKILETYGLAPEQVSFLPNIIDIHGDDISKSLTPRVVFLGRLDPIKRPWLFMKLAAQFPEVEFLAMGQSHFEGGGTWRPVDLPANVRLLEHVDGEDKAKMLASSWVLVNTSIHERLAISFLEALACGTPIISCQNPEDVISRFGVYVGRWDGAGLEALPKFVQALKLLLEDAALRMRLGSEGRAWVARTHTPTLFLQTFRALCESVGVAMR